MFHASVAQTEEYPGPNGKRAGSIPAGRSNFRPVSSEVEHDAEDIGVPGSKPGWGTNLRGFFLWQRAKLQISHRRFDSFGTRHNRL